MSNIIIIKEYIGKKSLMERIPYFMTITGRHESNSTNKDLICLKTISLSMVILEPLISLSIKISYPNTKFSITIPTVIFAAFLCLFISTLTSNYIKRNASYVLYCTYFISTITLILSGYFYNFPQHYGWLILIIVSTATLFAKRLIFLIIYMVTVLLSTIGLLYALEFPGIDKEIFSLVLIMFCLISYTIVKSRSSAEKALEKSENQIKKMAYYDALTELPNRNRLNLYLKETISQYDGDGKKLAVMFIDLDNFKNINDVFGHNFGDKLLQNVAGKLLSCVEKRGAVFRYGGDEFIVILDNVYQKKSCSCLAQKIIDEFSYPFHITTHEIYTSPSIGISVFPDHGKDVETLIKNSDTAMYYAKKQGKNNFQFFNVSLSKNLSRKIELENGLRKAILNNEFLLYYQPLVELNSYKIYGLEALLRWRHPTLGMISPVEFIPLAEDSGLIVPIGEWVMETAFRQCKSWHDSGAKDINISINVSGYQIKYSNICQTVRNKLAETGIPPASVIIEITESVMQDSILASQIVNELKGMGVKVAIDDFGTGYSSLGLLKNLNIDILKIDSSFINDIFENPNTLSILDLIIKMGQSLSFDIIIEGVETVPQVYLLEQNKCRLGQGFLFSRPLPAAEIEPLFDNNVKLAV